MRFYYETLKLSRFAQQGEPGEGKRRFNLKAPYVGVPTAAMIAKVELIQLPRSWIEHSHHLVQFTRLKSGGHFIHVSREVRRVCTSALVH